MFTGITGRRVVEMTAQETRWLENVRKAFYASDQAICARTPQEACLESLVKAIDIAKTLRRSLRGESVDHYENRKRFTHFLELEVPAPDAGGLEVELTDCRTDRPTKYSFAELVYAIRCIRVHENENLDAAEWTGYHITVEWQRFPPNVIGEVKDRSFTVNGHRLVRRLREVLAKFITGIDALEKIERRESFEITCKPPLGSIRPERDPANGRP